jgi:hypothetical protein
LKLGDEPGTSEDGEGKKRVRRRQKKNQQAVEAGVGDGEANKDARLELADFRMEASANNLRVQDEFKKQNETLSDILTALSKLGGGGGGGRQDTVI